MFYNYKTAYKYNGTKQFIPNTSTCNAISQRFGLINIHGIAWQGFLLYLQNDYSAIDHFICS